jgi:hypothetical protein
MKMEFLAVVLVLTYMPAKVFVSHRKKEVQVAQIHLLFLILVIFKNLVF